MGKSVNRFLTSESYAGGSRNSQKSISHTVSDYDQNLRSQKRFLSQHDSSAKHGSGVADISTLVVL